MGPDLCIPISVWEKTVHGLCTRSGGRRESGCIWAGKREQAWHIRDVFFLDDIPGTKRQSLYHRTPRSAISIIFEMLREKEYQIIADIHTHPSFWVGLSEVDKQHPIEYRAGLIAMIFPHYAQRDSSFSNIGVHKYLGSHVWRELSVPEIEKRFLIINEG
jgi:hypothetical protein